MRVNSVHPGFIDTAMVSGAIQSRGPELRQMIDDSYALVVKGLTRAQKEQLAGMA